MTDRNILTKDELLRRALDVGFEYHDGRHAEKCEACKVYLEIEAALKAPDEPPDDGLCWIKGCQKPRRHAGDCDPIGGPYTQAEPSLSTEPMVEVDPALRWHEHGCVKRYGAQSDVMCRCERLRAQNRGEKHG
jgi:hypothetical protein